MARLTIDGFEFFSHPTRTRFPFRYGIASMTEVPHLFARVRIQVDGRAATGLASEGLPPKWFTKDPRTTFDEDLPLMLAAIGGAAERMTEAGHKPRTFFELWQDSYNAQSTWAAHTGTAPLLANLGVSLCERAVIDALCRSLSTPWHRIVLENRIGLKLGAIHRELGTAEPRDLLPATPLPSVMIRHTVGLADPLTPDDIPAEERFDDGLPRDLESCIRAQRLAAFKVKLSGDTPTDMARLLALDTLLTRETGGDYLVTLDGNENFKSFGLFRAFWEQLKSEPAAAGLLPNIALVEQPVHRDLALSEQTGEMLSAWADKPALIIDESDGSLEDVPRALALGYTGASHKNCKGIVKGIANACLLEHHRRRGQRVLLTGEDLCNLGPVALLQDYAMMTMLGIPHVERNGHHYFRGLSPWPEAWQESTVQAHPDLYVRDPAGFVRVKVTQGSVHLGSVNAASFGVGPLFDPSQFPRTDLAARNLPAD